MPKPKKKAKRKMTDKRGTVRIQVTDDDQSRIRIAVHLVDANLNPVKGNRARIFYVTDGRTGEDIMAKLEKMFLDESDQGF